MIFKSRSFGVAEGKTGERRRWGAGAELSSSACNTSVGLSSRYDVTSAAVVDSARSIAGEADLGSSTQSGLATGGGSPCRAPMRIEQEERITSQPGESEKDRKARPFTDLH